MPIKTNVGLSKKLGLPHFGSVGASCSVEFELAGTLAGPDIERFQRQVRAAFVACRQAVEDELVRQRERSVAAANHGRGQTHGPARHRTLTPASGASGASAASDKQLIYLRRLASQIPDVGLQGLDALVEHRCGKTVARLSAAEASRLIDTLKSVQAGTVQLNNLPTGAST